MISNAFLDRLCAQATTDGIQQLVVGAVITHADTVLLLQRPANDFMGGIYELPSGKVNTDEALDAALHREVEEETGLQVNGVTDYLGSFDYVSGSGKNSRQFTFAVTVYASEPVTLTEHDHFMWAPVTSNLPVTEQVSDLVDAYRMRRASAV